METLKDLYRFLKETRNWWLVPIVLVLALTGILILLAENSAVAPFIYTVF